MAEAVADSLQYLSPEDSQAIVAYLRRIEPQSGTPGTQIDPAPATMTASAAWAPGPQDPKGGLGQRIFEGACASCHAWNGNGRETDYAALAGSQAVNDPQGVNLTQVLLAGANLKTRHGTGYMPGFGAAYTDEELAAVANYVIGHFGGKDGEVTAQAVRGRRELQQ
jgi:mono/diheme cytochrome c family protein